MVDDRQLAVAELQKWIEKHPVEFREGTERGQRDIKFRMDHLQQWRREHPNTWMAISEARLVAVEQSLDALIEALQRKGISPRRAYLFFVHDEKTSLAL